MKFQQSMHHVLSASTLKELHERLNFRAARRDQVNSPLIVLADIKKQLQHADYRHTLCDEMNLPRDSTAERDRECLDHNATHESIKRAHWICQWCTYSTTSDA